MKYVRFWGGNGYCGCDWEEYEEFDDDIAEEELDCRADELATDWAESYEYVVTGWDSDWEDEDDRNDYFENLDYNWEYITEEEYNDNV